MRFIRISAAAAVAGLFRRPFVDQQNDADGPRSGSMASNTDQKIGDYRVLVIGGSTNAKERGVLKSCEILHVAENGLRVWSTPFANLTAGRRGASCIRLHNGASRPAYLVVGGAGESEEQDDDGNRIVQLNSMEVFESHGADAWRCLPSALNVGRSCFMTARFGDGSSADARRRLLILGGWCGRDSLADVEVLDVDVDVDGRLRRVGGVRRGPKLVSPMKNGCAVSLSPTSALLVGGWDGRRTLRTIFRLSVNGNDDNAADWRVERLLPYAIECHACVRQPRRPTSVAENDGQSSRPLFIVGGFDGVRLRPDILRYDPDDDSLTVLPVRLAVARECHCAELVGVQQPLLVVFGGWDGYKALRSVEIFRVLDHFPYLEPVGARDDDVLLQPRNRACSVVYE